MLQRNSPRNPTISHSSKETWTTQHPSSRTSNAKLQPLYGVSSACRYVESTQQNHHQPIIQTANPKNDTERRQGIALIDESIKQDVKFFVYSSVDRHGSDSDHNPTQVPHFIYKHEIEAHLKERTIGKNMEWTILRPVAFFENLTPDYFGKLFATAWKMRLKGKPLQLVATSDIGFFAAAAFMNPEASKNHAFSLAGDELTFDEMASTFKSMTGKNVPMTFRFPAWLMLTAVKELGVMFKWFYDQGYRADIPALKKIHPGLKTFGDWLKEDSLFETL